MADPTRADALRALTDGQARIDALLAGLTDEQVDPPAGAEGERWSAKDVIGHIAAWEGYATDAAEAWRRGHVPWIEAGPLDVDAVNARDLIWVRARDLEDVRGSAARRHERLLAVIGDLSDQEWASSPPYATENRRTLGALLGAITGSDAGPFRHAPAHLADLEAASVVSRP